MSSPSSPTHADTLPARLRAATGQSVFQCYQCGKCTAGCPLAAEMDFAPNQIVRLLQLGFPELEKEALGALSIWLCLTCETCAARCPKEVNLPQVMEYLRQESLRRGLAHPKAKDILAFHQAFLSTIRRNGRLQEVELIATYKLKTLHLLQDVLSAPGLLMRGKLKLLPHKIDGQNDVERIFSHTQEISEHETPASAAHESKAD
jgi:heterodisulfide reductase subunit C